MSCFQMRKCPDEQMCSHLLLSGDMRSQKGLAVWPVIPVFLFIKGKGLMNHVVLDLLARSLTCKLTPSVFKTAVSLFSIKKQRFIFGVS